MKTGLMGAERMGLYSVVRTLAFTLSEMGATGKF